jgi:protease I
MGHGDLNLACGPGCVWQDSPVQKKIVAAVCHAPWLLIETGIARGSQLTSYKSIKTDVTNAGAKWEDSEVVVDDGVITSRNPGDLDAFSVIEAVKEGKHSRRSAA